MKNLRFLLIIAIGLLPEIGFTQSFYAVRKERSLILVGGLGTSTYFGELANPGDYWDSKPTINVGLQYYVTNRISIRSELTWFQLRGDDAKADESSRQKRNLSFFSNNLEFNAVGTLQLSPIGQRFYQRSKLNFYGFAGIGLLYFNPKTEYQGEKVALQPLQTEGNNYSRVVPVIPYGLGARIMLNPFLNISIEGGYRKVFTDYLDDVSTVHKDPLSFSDPIAAALADRRPEIGLPTVAPGTQRGNSGASDGYMLLTAKIEYYLPGDLFGNSSRKLYKNKRKAYYKKRRR